MLPVQRYVSDELTHFVGRSIRDNPQAQYDLLVKIIREGMLMHPPYDPRRSGNVWVDPLAKISDNEMYVPQMVCFCDIPVQDLGLHSSKYSRFGMAFRKSLLVMKGANPVFYIAKHSVVSVLAEKDLIDVTKSHGVAMTVGDIRGEALNMRDRERKVTRAEHFDKMARAYHLEMVKSQYEAHKRHDASSQEDPVEMVVKLLGIYGFLASHVFAYMKFFDETNRDEHPDNFYMEREWRVLGNVQFSLGSISRVILPEEFAEKFRADVPDYHNQVTFI